MTPVFGLASVSLSIVNGTTGARRERTGIMIH
jgi:hypothetical protein